MSYDPEQITFFAKTDARGQNVPFGIKAKDRTRHVYVIGKTGMGKSTLLENMAVQDMQNGNGLAFIDPHGATAETLLEYVPEDRVDDVLYFAPFDTERPIAFNVMEDVGAERRHLVAAGLMSVFKKIWVDAWSARMEYILQNTILALLEYPGSTLLGVNRMLSDKHYRKAVIENINDPAVKSFWVDEFLNYNERYMQEAGDAIKNKIGQFTANPLIRNIIGQPNTSFDLRKMMDEKKILIANLSKGLIGESNANLLGSMLTTRIYLAAMSRADLTPLEMKQAPNYYFYVDEFQSFANATFADILSEARKYHLNLTIAHQYVEQMEEEVRNAVFGNMGTIISFRVGPFDAEVLETIFAPQFYAVDIVNLGFAQIYLTLMIDGIGSRPFSATTLPPIENSTVSCRDMVFARSQEKFGFPRAEVEADINAWMTQTFQKNSDGSRDTDQSNGKGKPNQQPLAKKKSEAAKPANHNQTTSGQSKPKPNKSAPAKPDVNELRSILASIAKPDDESAKTDAPHTATPDTEKPKTSSKQADTNKTEKRTKANHTKKKQHGEKAAARKQNESADTPTGAGSESLKSALAAVLAEREAKQKPKPKPETTAHSTAPTTAQSAPETDSDNAAKEAPSPQPPAKPPADTPKKPDPAPTPETPTAEATPTTDAEHDSLDPKQLERMLRVTHADNSPFKKR